MASVLEIRSICKRLGNLQVLRDISLVTDVGAVVGLLGPNGAGKSTTLNIAAGLVSPDRGSVTICGFDLQTHRVDALARLGYVSDTPFLYNHLSAREFLNLVGRLRRIPDIEELTERLLGEFQLPNDKRTLGEFSLGMRKKVALSAALLPSPSVMIMDEPFNALDYAATVTLLEEIHKLRSAGMSVLVASHLMDLVKESCTHVAFMNNGQIAEVRALPEVLSQHPRLEDAFLAYCKEG